MGERLTWVNARAASQISIGSMTRGAHITPFDPPALERAVPRYTSYPTQPHFSEAIGAEAYARWLGDLAPERALRLYLHIPFCRRICWFCACRTQATGRYAGVRRYVDALLAEGARLAEILGPGRRVTELALGGGSPSVLAPGDLTRLVAGLEAVLPGISEAPVTTEIDPRDMTEERLDALAAARVSAVALSVQDVDPGVQAAIGRNHDHASTCRIVEALRRRGIRRISLDLLYGLPAQSAETLARSVAAVVALEPTRIALYGYAHLPWLAKRQAMIDIDLLPGSSSRRAQAREARALIEAAGYTAVGMDHFVRPDDPLARAERAGRLERSFDGYRVGDGAALLGLGASAVGALPQGYVQNETATARYLARIEGGELAAKRGHALSLDDRMRGAAIGQILCTAALDIDILAQRFGDFAKPVADRAAALLAAAPAGALTPWRGGFRISEDWRGRARLVAAEFDAYLARGRARHSLVI